MICSCCRPPIYAPRTGRRTDQHATTISAIKGLLTIILLQGTIPVWAAGTVVVWGDNVEGRINAPANLTGVSAVAAVTAYCLALGMEGSASLIQLLPLQTNILGNEPFYFSDPSSDILRWWFNRIRVGL